MPYPPRRDQICRAKPGTISPYAIEGRARSTGAPGAERRRFKPRSWMSRTLEALEPGQRFAARRAETKRVARLVWWAHRRKTGRRYQTKREGEWIWCRRVR